jgi:rfaE bifunctional protein kinase chain/domain
MSLKDELLSVIDRFDQVDVVLLGDLVLDRFVLGTPKRISREAPVIILRHEGQRDIPGGGANALANLVALDVPTVPVGVVGDDAHGAALLDALADRGVDVSRIVVASGYRTPTKVRILGGGPSSLKHQVARYDIEDQLPEGKWLTELEHRLAHACSSSQALAVSDYGYGAAPPHLIESLGEDARPRWICVDSRYRLCFFAGVDGATPNLEELERCAGHKLTTDQEVARAGEELRSQLGASLLLATRGNRGMTLVESGAGVAHLGVFGSDQVADVTGAGDTVLAVFVASLAAGASPTHAAMLANYAGGLVVMKLGTATVTRHELAQAVTSIPPGEER